MQCMEKEAEWLFNDPHWLALVCARLPKFLQNEPDMKHRVEKKTFGSCSEDQVNAKYLTVCAHLTTPRLLFDVMGTMQVSHQKFEEDGGHHSGGTSQTRMPIALQSWHR